MSSRVTFGTIKRVGAILIAIVIVLAAGIIVGQAPALFGVEDDPEASIEFEDQRGDGEAVVIDEVSLSDGGFVVLTDGGDDPIAVSDYLESGTHENVTVERAEDADEELVGRLTATVHQDTTGDGEYAYEETDGEEDRPYLEAGFPVSDTATVTTDEEDVIGDSFAVESVDAPDSATTDEEINVTAEISNPTDLETQQNVDIRLDGTVLERQAVELEPGERAEVDFEIETAGTPPGDRMIGVYTEGDGELESIELEFHTEPTVEIVDASEDNVSVDVATPVDGFVAVEADNETIATSEALEPGEHSNVTAEFEENVTVEDDDELTAVLYEGDPDDLEAATPFEDDDERVETTVTLEEIEAEADDEAETGDAEGDAAGDEDET
ncbi:DUF4179 domain-containing protein [Natronolimnohabitans sp. A-GB9]|uniref:DUF7282 domain-containing protein n=1 Tax=Natronolimnohabitans sp. A-GB9 TaxID=3069757 RepID=UPI0027B2CEC3|nr:DUF4179 domain-containing protein [Natronolimnohabitans sp. A-GB9]MDQ2050218.1 DUF4179 domain-containing protein [Natronolimnohabitans sp. A-GB9]